MKWELLWIVGVLPYLGKTSWFRGNKRLRPWLYGEQMAQYGPQLKRFFTLGVIQSIGFISRINSMG